MPQSSMCSSFTTFRVCYEATAAGYKIYDFMIHLISSELNQNPVKITRH